MPNRNRKANGKMPARNNNTQPDIPGYHMVTDAEYEKGIRREREYRAMQEKLTRLNEERRGEVPARAITSRASRIPPPLHMGKDSRYQAEVMKYFSSILDPFNVRGARIPSELELPTVTFSVTSETLLEINTNSEVGSLRVLAPCHFTREWAASGNANNLGTSPNFDATHPVPADREGQEFYRYNGVDFNYVEDFFPKPGEATLAVAESADFVHNGEWVVESYVPAKQYKEIRDLYSHTRLVSGGIRLKYTGEPLAAKGRVVVALLPPGVAVPANWQFAPISGGFTPERGFVEKRRFEYTFEGVQALPGAQVFSAFEDITITLRPWAEDVEEWCPTKYYPPGAMSSAGLVNGGVDGFPAMSGDPERWISLIDSLQVHPGATQNAVANQANIIMRNIMTQPNQSWPTIIVMYDGCDPNGTVSMELTSNYEAVVESRAFNFTSTSDRSRAVRQEVNEIRDIALHLPAAHRGTTSLLPKIWGPLKKAVNYGSRIVNAAGGGRKVVQQIGKYLGTEVPELFGTIAEDAAIAGAFML